MVQVIDKLAYVGESEYGLTIHSCMATPPICHADPAAAVSLSSHLPARL